MMTQDEMDADLAVARFACERLGLSVDRCRHETVTQTSIWVFSDADKTLQVGAIRRIEEPGFRWHASRMPRGTPTSAARYATQLEAIQHVAGGVK